MSVMELNNEIDLNPHTDYIISTKIDIFKHLIANNKPVIVLTLFEKKKTEIKQKIMKNINSQTKQPHLIISTPCSFELACDKHDYHKQIVIYEPHLIEDLGYRTTIENIRTKGYTFIAMSEDMQTYSFLQNPLALCINQQYYIKCADKEVFYILFAIHKFSLLHGSIAIVADGTTKIKIEIFLKAMGSNEPNVFLNEDIDKISVNNLIVVGVQSVACKCDRIIYLADCAVVGVKEYVFDYERVSRYRYRIYDFINALSPAVLKGKKSFNYERFKSLRNDI